MRANVVGQYLTNKGNTGLEVRELEPGRFSYSGIWAPRSRIVDGAQRMASIVASLLRSHPHYRAEVPFHVDR